MPPTRAPMYGYVVEAGVPMPPKEDGRMEKGRREKYPWLLMSVGDSFWVPAARGMSAMIQVHHRNQVYVDTQFEFRTTGGGGVRVWRVR